MERRRFEKVGVERAWRPISGFVLPSLASWVQSLDHRRGAGADTFDRTTALEYWGDHAAIL